MIPSNNTLYESDCLETLRQWDDACIDHCITDPPYNMSKKNGLGWAFSSHVTMSEDWDRLPRAEYLEFSRAWLKEVCRVVKPNGNLFIFGSFHNIYDLGYLANELDLRVLNSIVWFKPNAQPNITRRTLTESTEQILWLCNAPKDKASGWVFDYEVAKQLGGGKQMRNLWSFPYPSPSERQYGKHPSQKTLDLITRIVLIATRPHDLILDCFAGSGTTGVAAQSFDRRWVMIENNPEYCAIARERLAHVKAPQPPELGGSAEPARSESPRTATNRPQARERSPERNHPPRPGRPQSPRTYTMDDASGIARDAAKDIAAWLEANEHTLSLKNVEDDPEYRRVDVDLLWQTHKQTYKVEIKGDRWHSRGNFFFETESNREKGTPGCFLYSQADLLFYYFVTPKILYILPMAETRRWFLANMARFEERLTTTAVGSKGGERYTTAGRLVPIETVVAEVPGVVVEKLA